MVVSLRHRITSSKMLRIKPVGFNNFLTRIWVLGIEPGEQGRSNIKTDLTKVPLVYVWLVALGKYSFIPIEIRCASLYRDFSCQRIFARRLVEMSMDDV